MCFKNVTCISTFRLRTPTSMKGLKYRITLPLRNGTQLDWGSSRLPALTTKVPIYVVRNNLISMNSRQLIIHVTFHPKSANASILVVSTIRHKGNISLSVEPKLLNNWYSKRVASTLIQKHTLNKYRKEGQNHKTEL